PSRYEPVRPWSGDRLVQVDAAPEMTVAATRPVPSAAASAVHERPMPDRQAASPIDAEPFTPRAEPTARQVDRDALLTRPAMPRTDEAPLPPPARPAIADSIADSMGTPRVRPTRASAASIEEGAQQEPLAHRPLTPPLPAPAPALHATAMPPRNEPPPPLRLPRLDATLVSARPALPPPPRAAADLSSTRATASPPAPATTRRAVHPAAAANAARNAPPPRPAPPPPIEVTIGRVEIRAVAPPAAPARTQRTAGPRLSLDDYLRRRDGGGGAR
ncbi:MAG: hypothetical protein KGN16_26460, partial [Burkholderiales bacterium]|nr:hypothetical protein [Burkholderiales bacterium]